MAFDIFRFDEDGKIAEHWDVMAAIPSKRDWKGWQRQVLSHSGVADTSALALGAPGVAKSQQETAEHDDTRDYHGDGKAFRGGGLWGGACMLGCL